ncbi:penicillin-binding protein 2 [Sphingomonas sp. SUN039]|uniref:peptidoglycan D,D-transpeptidase FtsI family protein n=1 Tax=Sphingomonas sp. SUN039 TaxID=2937787 RepID=UPI002164B1AF|nr:penicillin-binding protein 2 [Sphingomonas sp. SUN039]UVO54477.1 penicillin-binding protein 2 [Sphingomonas sp. SUN039]
MTTLVAQPARIRNPGERTLALATTHQRLMLLMLLFAAGALVVVARIAWMGVFAGEVRARIADKAMARGDIVDRNGRVLARTIEAWSIGIHTDRLLTSPETLAQKLAELMPEKTADEYHAMIRTRQASKTPFTYLRRRAMPELVAAVNALGEPGIGYAREPERLYPQTTLAAHVLGYTDLAGNGVTGMERVLNTRLSDPSTRGIPTALAIDARVQAVMESELYAVMVDQQAVGAGGIVLDVHTGEIVAMVSLPVFNPNKPSGEKNDALWRNAMTQSVYELGSTFKPITVANAMDSGVVTSMAKRYDATAPISVGGFKIHDDHPMGRWLNIPEMLIHSSNIVTARVADQLGQERTAALFRKLHFDARPDVELKERGTPIWPDYWGRTTVMTVGYGHGMAVTPLHLASAYAALVNGGIWRPSTLMKVAPGKAPHGSRVFSQATSDRMRQLLRMIVTDGTGRSANVAGMRVGGKTGTAEKASEGGYAKHSIVATFACAFPMDAPRYVVIGMVDEPKGSAISHGQRTAAFTVAPAVGRIIARAGPMLGIVPDDNRDIDVSELTPLVWKAKGD